MKTSNTLALVLGQAALILVCLAQLHCASDGGDDTSTGAAGSGGGGATGQAGTTGAAGSGGAGVTHIVGCRNPPKDDDRCLNPRPACADPMNTSCLQTHPEDPAIMDFECVYRLLDQVGCPCVEFSVRRCSQYSQSGVQRCRRLPGQDDQTEWGPCGGI